MKKTLMAAFFALTTISSYASSQMLICEVKGENIVSAKQCSFVSSDNKSCSLGRIKSNAPAIQNETEIKIVARPLIELDGSGEYVAAVELSYLDKNGADVLGINSRIYANSSRGVFGTFEAECRNVTNP
jgi:hypothetical protein